MTATITVHGGLTSPPELRYSQGGVPIANGSIASTDRYKDAQSGEWKDGKKLYLRWSAFKDLAENIAASNLDKGAQVVITGKLITREYQDREGQSRSSTELEVIDFAVSLKRAVAAVTKTQSGQGGQSRAQVVDEPWATPGQGSGGASSYGDDTPADLPF